LTPVLRTGTFATHTSCPPSPQLKVPRELPVEQACLIGCALATGVMSVLETAKVWRGRALQSSAVAVGLPVIQGARIAGASENSGARPRPSASSSRRGTRRDAYRARAGRLRFDVVGRGATFAQALG